MAPKIDKTVTFLLLAIAVFLGIIALRPLAEPGTSVLAQGPRFEHVSIASAAFLYKGEQGLLVWDRRNANVWFIPKRNDAFGKPVFMLRLPFDQLDQAPQ